MSTAQQPAIEPENTERSVLARQALGRWAPIIALALVISNGWWFWNRLDTTDVTSPSHTQPTSITSNRSTPPTKRPTATRTRQPPAATLVRVPAVAALTSADGKRLLISNNLRLGRREWIISDRSRDTIVSSSPEAGTRVQRQARVDLTISAGPLQSLPIHDVTITQSATGHAFSQTQVNAQPGSLLVVSSEAMDDCAPTSATPPSESGSPTMSAGMKSVFYLMSVSTYEISCASGSNTLTVRVTD